MQPEHLWLSVHALLGLLWIALLTSRAEGRSGIGITGPQPITMPVLAGWPAGRLVGWPAGRLVGWSAGCHRWPWRPGR
jgi:hypothetical protein